MPKTNTPSHRGRLSRPARIRDLEAAARELAAEYRHWLGALPANMVDDLARAIEQIEEVADDLANIDPPTCRPPQVEKEFARHAALSQAWWPGSLQKRERALETLVRGIAEEYWEILDGPGLNSEFEAHLQRKIGALNMIADELGGIQHLRPPGNPDDEVPF